MKVSFEKDYRRLYTLEDVDAARVVMEYEKEDEETAAGWAEMAAREAVRGSRYGFVEGIITAKAETAKNCRIWDAYGDGSKDMDIWITATVKVFRGFLEIGAYLSDIWQTGAERYTQHMYICRYTFDGYGAE